MSGKHIAKEQPKNFIFSNKNLKKKDEIFKKYPETKRKSAIMPLLYLVQKQNNGWIPLVGVQYVADILDVPYIKVFEVATFYSMYNLAPVGKYFVQVCTTTPCMIRGSSKIVDMCKKYISEKQGQLSKDEKSSWVEVECLGACVNAPVIQINDDYYEDLNSDAAAKIFKCLKDDELPKIGSQQGRRGAEPATDRLTLIKN